MSTEKDVKAALTKAKSLSSKTDDLERQLDGQGKAIKQIANAVNTALGQLERSLNEYKEMLNAVIGILGPQQVQAEIENSRLLALAQQVEETKASIAKALEAGELTRAEKTSEKSFVAGVEVRADGTTIAPGWAFVPMQKIEEEYRTQLLGQAVGFKVSTKEGGSFELLEIYEAVEKPTEPAAKAPVDSDPSEAAPRAEQGEGA